MFRIDQHQLLLLQIGTELLLLEANCPHRGHPLLESDVEDSLLRCPLHGYQFNLVNGELLYYAEERCRGLKRYELVYRDNQVGALLWV